MPRIWNRPLSRLQQSQRDRQQTRDRARGLEVPEPRPQPRLMPLADPMAAGWPPATTFPLRIENATLSVNDTGNNWTDLTAYVTSANMNWGWQGQTTSIDWTANTDSLNLRGSYTYTPTDWSTASDWQVQVEPRFTAGYWTSDGWSQMVATGGLVAPMEPVYAPAITQEEADRRLAATRAAQHKNAVLRKRAIKRGRKLLLAVLTEEQQREYARRKAFTVKGADGKMYVIRKGGTTHELDVDGRAIFSHCIHLPYSYIDEDTLVGLKLLLETDPKEFRRIANTSRISVPSIPQVMLDRAVALEAGMEAVNERFRQLSVAAREAQRSMDSLGRAIQYAGYARELEAQVAAEETGGLALPLAARQYRTAQALGHAETIAGEPVAALAA